MLNNEQFLGVVLKSFEAYLNVNSSRSTAKLKVLHGAIAKDLKERYGEDFSVKSQGIGDGKEEEVDGRYYSKKVDITISHNDKPVSGYAIKFVVRNYSQNSNNYFEDMLGETANLRAERIPYYQIFVVFEKVPYYEKEGVFKKYDVISRHNLDKYIVLSNDDASTYYHTPDKTLLVLLRLDEKEPGYRFRDSQEYAAYYKSVINREGLITYSEGMGAEFGNGIILNDYEKFVDKTIHITKGNMDD